MTATDVLDGVTADPDPSAALLAVIMFRPTLRDIQALSTELGTAIGAGKEWGRLSDGATYVAAHRDRGRRVIVGCCGGWRAVRCPEQGPAVASDPFDTAAAAVHALEAP